MVSIKDTFFYITILVFFLPSSATLHKKSFNSWILPFLFIMKVDNLWPWPWPLCINISNRFDINLNSCYYYLIEYIKGFINIIWKHYKILFQNMTKLLFFRLFWKCTIVTLTLTFTFIFIICLGFGVNKRYFFSIRTILVFFLPS